MSRKQLKKHIQFNSCVYVNQNFDYKKDKYEQNLRYFRDPNLAAISAGVVVPSGSIKLKKFGRKSVSKSISSKFKINENKEQLLQKVSMGRKDIMEIKIQYFEFEELLEDFMSTFEKQQKRAQRRPKIEQFSPPRQLRASLDDFKENYSSVKGLYNKLQKEYMAKEDLCL